MIKDESGSGSLNRIGYLNWYNSYLICLIRVKYIITEKML
jgi:hypothetical protein